MSIGSKEELLENRDFQKAYSSYLKDFITSHKIQMMDEVLSKRTRHFTVVLEDIFKPHNASAVIRSCDCFGIQDIHVIEKTTEYKINPFVTRGASQWVDLNKYYQEGGGAVNTCFTNLRNRGYKIVGTSPVEGTRRLQDLDPGEKLALVFGNEHEGISEEVKEDVDELIHIPMMGFTESFNISVSVALCLFELTRNISLAQIPDFFLLEGEKELLRLQWYQAVVKNSEAHFQKFSKMYLEDREL